MPFISLSPAYNLKVVLKETGLKADVLRAWERRYDLPKPQRSPGGHRLYSEYDIKTIKWLRARQAEGLSISRAVELWKEIIEVGSDPLSQYTTADNLPVVDLLLPSDTNIEKLRKNWVEANMAFDSIRVDEIINQSFSLYSVETVCNQIIQQGIHEIGQLWQLGKATVQQEHFASAMASRRLEALISTSPQPTRQQTILVGCPPGELHAIPVLLVCVLLVRRGLKVVYLGNDIPIDKMGETSAAIRPDLIVMAAQQLVTAATLQSTALALMEKGILLAYGGLIFNRIPKLRDRIPGFFLGETIDGSIQRIDQILTSPRSLPDTTSDSKTFQETYRLFREKRALIELALSEQLQNIILNTEHFLDANFFFGNSLSAALALGNPTYAEVDIEWVKKLLSSRNIPADQLIRYLTAYSHVINQKMGSAGAPITDWLSAYIEHI